MAIITTENDLNYFGEEVIGHKPRKYVTHTRLVKTDITRQGINGFTKTTRRRGRRHDPKTTIQLAYRAVMQVWGPLAYADRLTWPEPSSKNFFATNVPRALAGLPLLTRYEP